MRRIRRLLTRMVGVSIVSDSMLWEAGAVVEWTSGNVIDWD